MNMKRKVLPLVKFWLVTVFELLVCTAVIYAVYLMIGIGFWFKLIAVFFTVAWLAILAITLRATWLILKK